MERFATVEDLEARWRELDDVEAARADVLLGDASARLSALLRDAGIDDIDDLLAENLKAVCCNMVQRVMASSSAELFGVTQHSQTAGSYNESFTYSNPTGDMYLTTAEMKLLGLRKQRSEFIRGAIHDCEGEQVDNW